MNIITETLKNIKEKGLYPDIKTIEGSSTEPEAVIDGKKILVFCSNNYLGIAGNKRVKKVMIKAVEKYGMGSGGSRLISGNLDIHNKLETVIANFKGTESAITFLAGYMANIGTIPAVLRQIDISSLGLLKNIFKKDEQTVIFSDELNHASIIDSCRLSNAEKVIYKHKDMNDLEAKIKKYKKQKNLIVTDGIFSMDGDITPLQDIMRIAKESDIIVMVDDAHASGVLGKNGRGTAEHFGLEDKVDITMGTFTKAFGGVGGFISGSKDLIDYLKITARTYIFSAPIPPVVSAGLIEAIEIVLEGSEIRRKLWNNVKYLRSKLELLGYDILGETQIIPLLIGSEKKAISFSRELFSNNIFIPCVRWPAVPKNQARLRITVMASHTQEQIDQFLTTLEVIGKKLSVI